MSQPFSLYFKRLKEKDVKIIKDAQFSKISYVRIGGMARAAIFPKNEQELIFALDLAKECGIHSRVLGRMSNILPPDGVFDGVIIKTDNISEIEYENDVCCAGAGVSLARLCASLLKNGLSCLEELSGIPASVGGAVYMNAGAYGREISDNLISVLCYDKDTGILRELSLSELDFSYRHSSFSETGHIILSARFRCIRKEKEDIKSRMLELGRKRRKTQPLSYPSLGSIFKRTPYASAAELIDKAGLKGFRIGDCEVSKKHAGFIVNLGSATSEDYKSVIEAVRTRVRECFGVQLEEEIEYLK